MGNRQTNKQSYRIRASTTENHSDSDEGGDEITLNPSSGFDHIFKVYIIGDSRTGKTKFSEAICGEEFTTRYIANIGIDIKVHSAILDGKRIKSQVHDTAGQDRFRSITLSHLRSAVGIFIMFDVMREDTFINVSKWMLDVKNHSWPNIPVMLVGNKCDQRSEEKPSSTMIQYQRAKTFADKSHLPYIETSCLDGTNVEYAHISMIALITRQTHDVKSLR